jgi:hypothetical protein
MNFLTTVVAVLEIIKKFFSFIFSKTEEFKREKEEKNTEDLKNEIKDDIENGRVDKINDRFKF